MTRDEAITVLLNVAWLGTNEERERTEEAVGMAIEALKQGDVLQEIRQEIDKYLYDNEFGSEYRADVASIIDKHIGDKE